MQTFSSYAIVGLTLISVFLGNILSKDNELQILDFNSVNTIISSQIINVKIDKINSNWNNIITNLEIYNNIKNNIINQDSNTPDYNLIKNLILSKCSEEKVISQEHIRNYLRSYLLSNSLFRYVLLGPEGDIEWIYTNYKTYDIDIIPQLFNCIIIYTGLLTQWYQELSLLDISENKIINPVLSLYIGDRFYLGVKQPRGTLLGELQYNVAKINDMYIYMMTKFFNTTITDIQKKYDIFNNINDRFFNIKF